MTKKRNPLIAALLGFLGYGLGFLYVGKPKQAFLIAALGLIIFPLFGWTRLMLLPGAVLVAVALLTLMLLVNVLVPAIMAWRRREVEKAWYHAWWAYLGLFLVTLGIGLFSRTHRAQVFGFDMFRIPSTAMADTIQMGDFIVTDSWAYRHNAPRRGDVVVFAFADTPSVKLVKRVVGLPGETVTLKGGAVIINGTLLKESYVNPEHNHGTATPDAEVQVPAGSYFVLGDNRDRSYDSRQKGPVPLEAIDGKVEGIWVSYTRGQGFHFDRVGRMPAVQNP